MLARFQLPSSNVLLLAYNNCRAALNVDSTNNWLLEFLHTYILNDITRMHMREKRNKAPYCGRIVYLFLIGIKLSLKRQLSLKASKGLLVMD